MTRDDNGEFHGKMIPHPIFLPSLLGLAKLALREFISAENLSPLVNITYRDKLKPIILNQYKLNKQDLKIQETSYL